jgi:hypothetical protein
MIFNEVIEFWIFQIREHKKRVPLGGILFLVEN